MTARILLVRHGPSAHPPDNRWIRADGVRRYEKAYNAAGILTTDSPPASLLDLAARAEFIVASDMRRAIESARRLAPDREPHILPALREFELEPPWWLPVPMPIGLWDVISHAQWSYRLMLRARHDAVSRAAEAVDWLAGRAGKAATVVAVTHGGFRRIVANSLAARGWQVDGRRGGYANWSVWAFSGGG